MELRCSLYETNGRFEFIETTQEEWAHIFPGKVIYYDLINKPKNLTWSQIRTALNMAMTTWDLEVDVVFKPVWGTDKDPDITIDFKTPEEDDYFKRRPSVLAYAYLPGQGKNGIIVFNLNYIWTLNGKPIKARKAKDLGLIDNFVNPDNLIRTYNIIHVLIHELGHVLGLRHDAHHDTKDVMDAFYDGKVLDLSEWDIYRIRKKYPIRIFKWWQHYSRLKRWLRARKRRE